VAEKVQPHTEEIFGRVSGQVISGEGHFITLFYCLVVDEVTEGLNGNGCYTLGICYPHEPKIPKYCLAASSGGFKYGTTMVRYNSGINPSTKGSAPGSISY